jgi:hypothetical protein
MRTVKEWQTHLAECPRKQCPLGNRQAHFAAILADMATLEYLVHELQTNIVEAYKAHDVRLLKVIDRR